MDTSSISKFIICQNLWNLSAVRRAIKYYWIPESFAFVWNVDTLSHFFATMYIVGNTTKYAAPVLSYRCEKYFQYRRKKGYLQRACIHLFAHYNAFLGCSQTIFLPPPLLPWNGIWILAEFDNILSREKVGYAIKLKRYMHNFSRHPSSPPLK